MVKIWITLGLSEKKKLLTLTSKPEPMNDKFTNKSILVLKFTTE